jgi:hypothetical protein
MPNESKNWHELATQSHYLTAREIQNSLAEGNLVDAETGLQELVEAMSRADRRAAKSQLLRLMKHVIKWQTQPAKRSRSWQTSILNARDEIRDEQQENPSITRELMEETMWETAFRMAAREAMAEMQLSKLPMNTLTWEEVFEKDYLLPE